MIFPLIAKLLFLLIGSLALNETPDSLVKLKKYDEKQNSLCSSLPKYYRKICLEVIDWIDNKKDEQSIKGNINSQIHLNKEIPSSLKTIIEDEVCDKCKATITLHKKMLNNSFTEEDILFPLIKTCSILKGYYKYRCIMFIRSAGRQAIKAVFEDQDPQKVCTILKFCLRETDRDTFPNVFELLTEPREDICNLCLNAAHFYAPYVNTENTKEYVQQIFFDMCNIFQNKNRDNCIMVYSTFGLDAIKFILKRKNPRFVCQTLHLCPKIESDILVQTQGLETVYHGRKEEVCHICTHSLGSLERNINRTLNATDIQDPLVKACSIYNCDLQHYCILFFQGRGLEIIQSILNERCPKRICEEMKLCRRHTEGMDFQEIVNLLISSKRRKSGKFCNACINIVKLSENYINTTNTAEEVQYKMFNVCENFQTNFKEKCRNYFSTTGFQLIKESLAKEEPRKICGTLKFCHLDEKKDVTKVQKREKLKTIEDDNICEKLTKVILERAVETKNENILERFSRLIVENLPRNMICKVIQDHWLKTLEPLEECALCRQVVFVVRQYTLFNQNKKTLATGFDRACLFLPLSASQQCHKFINKYKRPITLLFLNNTESRTICDKLQICDNNQLEFDTIPKNSL